MADFPAPLERYDDDAGPENSGGVPLVPKVMMMLGSERVVGVPRPSEKTPPYVLCNT